MSKKAFLALLLTAAMLLSGCSLVKIDKNVDNLLTIIDVNGSLVNKEVFNNTFSYNLYIEQYYASMLAAFGGDGTVDNNAVLESTIDTIVKSLVTTQKSTELGFDQLTEEDEALIRANAEAQYAEELESVKSYYFANSELGEEELTAAVLEYAENAGITVDALIVNERAAYVANRLRASVTDKVSITSADIQSKLDALIAAEKETYAASPAVFGSSRNLGQETYYTPAGYRTVSVIELKKPTEEGAEDTAKTEIEALSARVAAGESFDTLSESVKTYAVCAQSTDVDAAVVEAAMALTAAGNVSAVVETQTGYALVRFDAELAEGAVALEQVADTLYDTVLAEAQDAAYNTAVESWIAEADVKIYRENLAF